MRCHTVTILQLHDDPLRYTTLLDVSYEYTGVVADCKKGRGQMEANMKADAAAAAANRANSQAAYAQTQKNLEPYNAMGPAGMTNAANAQLAADRDNIARTYNGMRQTAFRTMGQRGFGSAPSGFSLAQQNGLDVGQEGSETGAFRNAQVNSQNQRNFATGIEAGLTGTEGNLGNSASGESTSAAVARNHAGSTFGDVMGGIGDIFPAIGAAKALGKTFSKMGQPSGVGDYGGEVSH